MLIRVRKTLSNAIILQLCSGVSDFAKRALSEQRPPERPREGPSRPAEQRVPPSRPGQPPATAAVKPSQPTQSAPPPAAGNKSSFFDSLQWEQSEGGSPAHQQQQNIVDVGQSHFFEDMNADSDDDESPSVARGGQSGGAQSLDDDFAALSTRAGYNAFQEGAANDDSDDDDKAPSNNGGSGWAADDDFGEFNQSNGRDSGTLLDFGFGGDDNSAPKKPTRNETPNVDLFDVGPSEPSNFDLLSGFGGPLPTMSNSSSGNLKASSREASHNNVSDLLGGAFDPFQSSAAPPQQPTPTARTPTASSARPVVADNLFDPFQSNSSGGGGFDAFSGRLGSSENDLMNMADGSKPSQRLTATVTADSMTRNNSAPYLHTANGNGTAKSADPFASFGK